MPPLHRHLEHRVQRCSTPTDNLGCGLCPVTLPRRSSECSHDHARIDLAERSRPTCHPSCFGVGLINVGTMRVSNLPQPITEPDGSVWSLRRNHVRSNRHERLHAATPRVARPARPFQIEPLPTPGEPRERRRRPRDRQAGLNIEALAFDRRMLELCAESFGLGLRLEASLPIAASTLITIRLRSRRESCGLAHTSPITTSTAKLPSAP